MNDKYESAGGDGAGHDSSPKQNQQKHGSQTNIPGELENGHGVRQDDELQPEASGVKEAMKSPKIFPPPGYKKSE